MMRATRPPEGYSVVVTLVSGTSLWMLSAFGGSEGVGDAVLAASSLLDMLELFGCVFQRKGDVLDQVELT